MPKFMHLRSTQGRGGVTIAFNMDTVTQTAFYAIARCNPKDNFCRRTGRVKAGGRLLSPKWVKDYKYVDYKDLKQHFLTYHPDHVVVPEVKDRSYGRSAVSAGIQDMSGWENYMGV